MRESIYLHNWSEGKLSEMTTDFELKPEELEGCNVLLASYTYECYSGDAFVLFEKDGKLYEVNGGHCSCYGLEGQWCPEETSIKDLRHRLEKGTLGMSDYCDEFQTQLKTLLDALESEGLN